MLYLTSSYINRSITVDQVRQCYKSDAFFEKITACGSEKARSESLSAYLLLSKTLLLAGIDPRELELTRSSEGRPYAVGARFDFSLSHTKNRAVCALSVGCGERIGVDIESIPKDEHYLAIAKRFFSESEKKELDAASNAAECFTVVWTKKEACLKYFGRLNCDISKLGESERGVAYDVFKEGDSIVTVCRSAESRECVKLVNIEL